MDHGHPPIVLVCKKDGSTCFCVDFRKENEVTRKDAQPLPRIDNTIDALEGAKWFSWLVATGRLRWTHATVKRSPFPHYTVPISSEQCSLANAMPLTFQRLMEQVLVGLHWTMCLVYLDDIIIFSKTIEDHMDRLCNV